MNTVIKRINTNGNFPETTFGGMVEKMFHNNLNRQLLDDNFWGFGNLDRKVSVPVNIKHTDKNVEMQLVVPGLKKEDFKISLEKDLLTISYEHKEENNESSKDGNWSRIEYKTQSFTRSFNVDETLDTSAISAKYNDGILFVNIPKKENLQSVAKTIGIE